MATNQESQGLSPRWHKAKIIAEIFGLVVIPLLIVCLTNKYSETLKEREKADRRFALEKEIGVRYVEISVGILREDPGKQVKGLRPWALDIFAKYSPVPLSREVIEELKTKSLPISFSYAMTGGAVAGGSAKVEMHHVPAKLENSNGSP